MRYIFLLTILCLASSFSFGKTIIHQDNFDDCNTVSWTAVSGSSDNEAFNKWECTYFGGDTYMEIYDGDGVNEEDWLISPAFNMDAYEKEYFSFQFTNSTDISGLTLVYSTDYSGIGTSTAINEANWTSLPIKLFDIDNNPYAFNFSYQKSLDLSAISGTNVYLAFKFVSTGNTQGWGIDHVQLTADYYDSVTNAIDNGSKCYDLKNELHNLIKGHKRIGYTASSFDVWEAYFVTDRRMNDSGSKDIVYDIYSDNPVGQEAYEYTLGQDQDTGTSTGTEGNLYNREHVFPKSWWGGTSFAADSQYTDLHHLLPSDQYVNGQKSNHPLGLTDNPLFTSTNNSKVGFSSVDGFTGKVFEPRDEYKGDFARNYLYITTRYSSKITSWSSNVPDILENDPYFSLDPWLMELLLGWHADDPVSQREVDRNDAVYSIQGNRNPFIDHPEYVHYIWGWKGNMGCPSLLPVELSSFSGKVLGRQKSGLNWATATEINTSHFVVEHSINGEDFRAVGEVNAKGNSTEIQSYQFIHSNAKLGNNYYRLKMMDSDDTYEYSDIISLVHGNKEWFSLLSNVINGDIRFQFQGVNENVSISIINTAGQILQTSIVDGSKNEASMRLKQLPSAVYFVRAEVAGKVVTKRIFVK